MAASIRLIWSSSSPPWFFGPWPTQCRVSRQLGFYVVEMSAARPTASLYSQNTTLCPAPHFVRHLSLSGTSLCSSPLFVRHPSLSGTSLCPESRSNLICSYLTISSKDRGLVSLTRATLTQAVRSFESLTTEATDTPRPWILSTANSNQCEALRSASLPTNSLFLHD